MSSRDVGQSITDGLLKTGPRESSLIESWRSIDVKVGSLNVLMRDLP